MTEADLLTTEEREFVSRLGSLWNDLCMIVDRGATRRSDLDEAIVHVHALQHLVMAQAAARAYPNEFRRLGSVIGE